VFLRKIPIHHFHMNTSQFIKRKAYKCLNCGTSRHIVDEVHSHIRSRPTGQRTPENLESHSCYDYARKVSQCSAFTSKSGQHGFPTLNFSHEREPFLGLKNRSFWQST